MVRMTRFYFAFCVCELFIETNLQLFPVKLRVVKSVASPLTDKLLRVLHAGYSR